MKATAQAPSNIAFIKYWGKRDEKLRIPANSSISMNLSNTYTTTTVDFDTSYKVDTFFLEGKRVTGEEALRVFKHLDRLRNLAKMNLRAKVTSSNTFPKASGIASSASGFAALTLAASRAAGLTLNTKDLSILARIGSGSACRSIPDGFVEWKTASDSNKSYAVSLHPPDYWAICDLVAIVGTKTKKVSSSEGHALAESSPFYKTRLQSMPKKIREIKTALKKRDFTKFGEVLEAEAVSMHTVMMTSNPPLFYWLPATLKVMQEVWSLRDRGVECYFTIDAGPNIHVICEFKNAKGIQTALSKVKGVKSVLLNKPAPGARLI